MSKRIVTVFCLCVLSLPAWPQSGVATGSAASATDTADSPEVVPEQIHIVGQRPGPGLWKVSKGEHVLWVFGTYAPLPKNMEWRSQQVEAILAGSQEYLSPPSATTHVGFFRGLTLLPYAIGLKDNPDGATLHDVLPADVYARWLPLKKKYLGDDSGIERERPIFVADALYRKGLEAAGLSSGQQVQKAIEKMVKEQHIKTTSSSIAVAVDDPVAMMKDFKHAPLDDVACFDKTLERLETDLDAMRVRASAWATGDLEGIEKLSYVDSEAACRSAMNDAAFIKGRADFANAAVLMQGAWLSAAERALATNASTFAVLPMRMLLDPSGYLTVLQAKGYDVQKPE